MVTCLYNNRNKSKVGQAYHLKIHIEIINSVLLGHSVVTISFPVSSQIQSVHWNWNPAISDIRPKAEKYES